MTKEELKQEVEDWWNNTFKVFYLTHNQLDKMCSDLLEPREKRIAELETQIEKMKNCRNCKKFMIEGVCGHFLQVGWCKNWELRS